MRLVSSGVQDSAGAAGLVETATMVVQAERQQEALTISDIGGRSTTGQSVSVQRPIDTAEGYSTPRSSMGQRAVGQPSWLAGVEIPKWMSRLGSILQQGSSASPGELAPSPFPSPAFASPPGGQPFRLRSPGKARAIPSAPTPPSSSSIPAEAIQAEVQRQLHGVLSQLKDYADRNNELQAELEEVKGQLREERRRVHGAEHTVLPPLHYSAIWLVQRWTLGVYMVLQYLQSMVFQVIRLGLRSRDLVEYRYLKVRVAQWELQQLQGTLG